MDIWFFYLAQALIYVVFALSLNLLLGYAGTGVGGQRGVRRHRRLHHRLPHAEQGLELRARGPRRHRPRRPRRPARVAPGDEALPRVPDPPHPRRVVGDHRARSPPPRRSAAPTDSSTCRRCELFGWTLERSIDWCIPLLVAVAVVWFLCWRIGESPYGRVLKGHPGGRAGSAVARQERVPGQGRRVRHHVGHGRIRRRAAERLPAARHARPVRLLDLAHHLRDGRSSAAWPTCSARCSVRSCSARSSRS